MLVTKYVEDSFFEATKSGHLKFGSLKSYRSVESDVAFRLTDIEEGVHVGKIERDLINESISVGGLVAKNITIIGCGTSVAVEKAFNAYVYCLVKGGYNSDHHKIFNKKNNGKLSKFVVFDRDNFLSATADMFKEVNDGKGVKILSDKVKYVKKKASILDTHNIAHFRPSMKRAVFYKPEEYSYEREYRIAALMDTRADAIFTKEQSEAVQGGFVDAIEDYGSL